MAKNPTLQKREREKARRSHQEEKNAIKKQRREARGERPPGEPGVDPDIAGIVPGPQPIVDDDYPRDQEEG